MGGPASMDFAFDGELSPPKLPSSSSGFHEAIQGITSLPDKRPDPMRASGRPRPAAAPQRPSATPAEPRGKGGACVLPCGCCMPACAQASWQDTAPVRWEL